MGRRRKQLPPAAAPREAAGPTCRLRAYQPPSRGRGSAGHLGLWSRTPGAAPRAPRPRREVAPSVRGGKRVVKCRHAQPRGDASAGGAAAVAATGLQRPSSAGSSRLLWVGVALLLPGQSLQARRRATGPRLPRVRGSGVERAPAGPAPEGGGVSTARAVWPQSVSGQAPAAPSSLVTVAGGRSGSGHWRA